MLKKYDSLILTGYKIVFNPAELDKEKGITPEIRKLLETTLKKVLHKKKNVEGDIKKLIEEYPHLPQFKNYLSTYYSYNGELDKTFKLNQQIVKEHPDYFFGKVNLAMEYLKNKEFEKVPEILGETMELKSLYPNREVFHIEEVMSFFKIAIEYFVETGNIEAAESRLKIMNDLDKDNPKTKHAAERIFVYHLKMNYEKQKSIIEKSRQPKFIPKKKYKHTREEPSFINPEIKLLYQYGFQIDFSIIKNLLEIPRDILIEDLKKVIIDSIERYKYFKKLEWQDHTHSFIMHALFMLRELKAEEALETVLDIFRQSEKFLDYWFESLMTEYLWMVIYELSQNKLDVLREYIVEEGNYTYARTGISQAVSKIALDFPERRNEVIQWYYSVFNFFIEQKDNEKLIDTSLIGLMVGDVLDFKAVELEDIIVKLYEVEIVGLEVVGELDELLEDLHDKSNNTYKENQPGLEEIYKDFSQLEKRAEKKSDVRNENLYDKDKIEYTPLPEKFKNIGRNEKCPCGSGLKFKKCHGK